MRYFLFIPLLQLALFLSPTASTSRDSLAIYIFLLDECRISQEMTPYINALFKTYGQEIGFLGFFPNKATRPEGMQHFAKKYGLQFPVTLDHEKYWANQWQATILPEVILVNVTKQRIEYRGLINDLYLRPGKRRNHIKNHYLRAAIEDVRVGRVPSPAETTPVGCFINFLENENN